MLDGQGRRIYSATSGQFIIVVEGRPGASGQEVGRGTDELGIDGRPDIQVQSTRNIGNGSQRVCDLGPASQGGGGVPGIAPPSFDPSDPMITDALADFGCRFQQLAPSMPCTLTDASGEAKLINAAASTQFCSFGAATTLFPPGDTILSARLRDRAGFVGPTAQIVVRVATPTPVR